MLPNKKINFNNTKNSILFLLIKLFSINNIIIIIYNIIKLQWGTSILFND